MIAVDTNVMVYLLTGAGPGEKAVTLLARDPEWTAPPILMSELRNVLAGLIRAKRLTSSDAVEMCLDAQEILGDRVAYVPSGPVMDVALAHDLNAHDAEFVVLARRLGVPLVTEDQRILEGAPDVAVRL